MNLALLHEYAPGAEGGAQSARNEKANEDRAHHKRKLAVAATLAKLEAATDHFILTPSVGVKRAAEEVNQPTKKGIPLTLRDFQVSHTPAALLQQ